MHSYVTALAIFAFVASVTPGPNNVLLLTSGLRFGFWRTVPHIMGITIGVTTMILLTGIGFSELIARYPVVATVLRVFAVGYFLYLAYQLFRAGEASTDADVAKPFSVLDALLFQWINPKAWVFATTATAVYVNQENLYLSVGIIGLVFAIVNVPSIAVWALFGSALRRILHDRRMIRVINISMAVLLVLSLYPVLWPAH